MNKIAGYLISIVFFLMFFVWATFGKIFMPFKVFFPTFHIFFAVFAVLCSIFFIKHDFSGANLKFGKSPFFILPAAAFLISLMIAFLFFQGIPHIQDSVNYRVMAQNFAVGRLHDKMPEHYEFFQFAYMQG